jgi:predicted deacetylase
MANVRYLIRFDDICPGMNWEVWEEIERVLIANDVKPLLAVVPDNQDPMLNVAPPREDFWERVRGWQARGWTIALHGYQHLYVTTDGGILNLNAQSEFAGLSETEQREKLEKGLAIFKANGVDTRVWIAPSHSFDSVTVRLLPQLGVDVISDGLALHPFTEKEGVIWVPQQIWRFRDMKIGGIWTICNHHNDWNEKRVATLRAFIETHRESFTTLETVAKEYAHRRKSLADGVAWGMVKGRLWLSKALKR